MGPEFQADCIATSRSNFVSLLHSRAVKQSDRIAYTFVSDQGVEHSITYAQLHHASQTLAGHLQSYGLQGKCAMLLYPPSIDYIIAFLGCMYAGVIAVPGYPPRKSQSAAGIQNIITNCGAQAILSVSKIIPGTKNILYSLGVENTVRWIATDQLKSDAGTAWREPRIAADSLAFLQYTSGSTSEPKGVMVSHANLIHNSQRICESIGSSVASVAVIWLPPYHDMGLIGGILQPLYAGFPCFLFSPASFLQRPHLWLEAISRRKATISGGPNFAYELCLRKVTEEQWSKLDLASWSVAFNGAEPIRHTTLIRFAEKFAACGFRKDAFYPCYGLAESTLFVTGRQGPVVQLESRTLSLSSTAAHGDGQSVESGAFVSSGRNASDQRILIVNPDTTIPCEPNQVGEIWLSSPSVAQGYWNRPVETLSVFQARVAGADQGAFLRTGDLGFLRGGELFVTGRLKDLIIISGRNIYPTDIELAMENAHRSIRTGCTAAFTVPYGESEVLIVVVEVGSTIDGDTSTIVAAVRDAIAREYGIDVHAVVLIKAGAIPKTSSGKVKRYACREQYLADRLNKINEWLRPSMDNAIASLGDADIGSASSDSDPAGNWTRMTSEQILDTVANWLVERIAKQLGITRHEVDVHQSFSHYGLESMDAVGLVSDLQQFVRIPLSATLAWDYPTINSTAKYLAERLAANTTISTDEVSVSANTEAIAIVGLSCRFPGATDSSSFWDMLKNGSDAVVEVPADRWDKDELYESGTAVPGKMNTKWGGFLADVAQFDANFFGISPREASMMDPQQRIVLEVCWEALENAGIAPHSVSGTNTGVFLGIGGNDYTFLQIKAAALLDDPYASVNAFQGTGMTHSIAANRVSYLLNLRGPSIAIDTACSSSLVAVHAACQSLLNGECHAALAGGINLILAPEPTIALSQAGMMSPSGRCKTFDASADGYVRGEGCGMIVLKCLSDAIQDKNTILGVIRGSAITQDGRTNGLTAPSGPAQARVMRLALARSGVSPQEVSYVEAHGTGTPLGDPIEIGAIAEVYAAERPANRPLKVGSVKANIGHLEAAAGIAGLIKSVLMLKHGEIPAQLHLQSLNPNLSTGDGKIVFPRARERFNGSARRHIIAVNSFGYGGTNSHLILETGPLTDAITVSQSANDQLIVLSAKTQSGLQSLSERLIGELRRQADLDIADVAYTLHLGRTPLIHRIAFVCRDREQLLQILEKSIQKAGSGMVSSPASPAVYFMFPGQGSQYANMGLGLYQTEPIFRAHVDTCCRILQRHLDFNLIGILYPMPECVEEANQKLSQTLITQCALFVTEYALAQLWISLGVRPNAMIGHSLGEYVAACLSGVFTLEDALRLVAKRGNLMAAQESGAMLSVLLSQEQALRYLDEDLCIAAVNTPEMCVVSGQESSINVLEAKLVSDGIGCARLRTSHAFHSHMMEPTLDRFKEEFRQIQIAVPKTPFISNLTGTWITDEEAISPEYWAHHLRQTVQFSNGVAELLKTPGTVLLEVGPGRTLSQLAQRHVEPNAGSKIFTSLRTVRDDQPDRSVLLEAIGKLWTAGVMIDWRVLYGSRKHRLVPLPTYPFQRQRYWLNTNQIAAAPTKKTSCRAGNSIDDWLYYPSWKRSPIQYKAMDEFGGVIASSSWIVFLDEFGVGAKVAAELVQLGHEVITVGIGLSFKLCSEREYVINPANAADYSQLVAEMWVRGIGFHRLLHFWNIRKIIGETTTESLIPSFHSLLYLAQAIGRQRVMEPVELLVVTDGVHEVIGTEKLLPENAISLGVCKVISQEYQSVRCRSIDIVLTSPAEQAATHWAKQIVAECRSFSAEPVVAYRGTHRWVQYFEPVHSHESERELVPGLRKDGVYLITGGLGGIGLVLAQHLAETARPKLILTGRSGLPAREEWCAWLASHDKEDRTSGKIQKIRLMEQLGAEVYVVKADTTDREQMKRAFDLARDKFGCIHGVIHAAGIAGDGIIQIKTPEKAMGVISPKVIGARVLEQLLGSEPIDFLLLCSSIASIQGGFGQVDYCAANTFLDAFAHAYVQRTGRFAVSVNWDTWREVGMAVNTDIPTNLVGMREHAVKNGLSHQEGVAIFNKVLAGVMHQIIVSKTDLELRIEGAKSVNLLELNAAEVQPATQLQRRPELHIAYVEPNNDLQAAIADIWQEVLGIDSIGIHDNFFDLGGHSLMAVQILGRLKKAFVVDLSITVLFEALTIFDLANVIESAIISELEQVEKVKV